MKLSRIIKALFIAVLASALVYAVMIFVSDGPAVAAALSGFSPGVMVAILALSVGCYVLRGIRWGMLVRLAGGDVTHLHAIFLHMAGQTMSVSPGRIGEVLKPWLTRQTAGLPLSRGLALVFAERIADLIAVVILALGGLSALGGGTWTVAIALAAILAGTFVASSEWFHRLALGALSKQGWARRHESSATAISETIRAALSWRALLWSVGFSFVAWGLEGIGFLLCLRELGFDALGSFAAVSVYAVSTIAGALTFLPGGIGLTEASMAGILIAAGMAAAAASAATLLTRVATLWWAVILGWIVILAHPALRRGLLSGPDVD